MTYLECCVCGTTGPQVRIRLVEWAEPVTKRFDSLPLCVQRDECRVRVRERGETWPFRSDEQR